MRNNSEIMNGALVIKPKRKEIAKSSRYKELSEKEIYQLASSVQELFRNSGIIAEVEQRVEKERSPEASFKMGISGIKIRLGITWKTTTVTNLSPKGGIFDE